MAAKNTALVSVARHGSVSYGRLAPERLAAILLGEVPDDGEWVRVHQGLSETPLYRLSTLAKEIGLSMEELNSRSIALYGKSLEDMNQWNIGDR